MSVKTFGGIIAALLLVLLLFGVWKLTHPWVYEQIGPYAVRRNLLTGQVQIKTLSGEYVRSFEDDPYADPVSEAELKRVTIQEPAWDETGVLAARALVAPGDKPIKGRFALQIVILEKGRNKQVRDRSLRVTADWPSGALTPFVIRTGLSAPDAATEKTIITPQPTLFAGETTATP